MENITDKKYWLFLFISLLLVGGFYLINPEQVKAGDDDNLSGWAYSSNIGWVSFNALNCSVPGFCDADSCISAGENPPLGHPGCPPAIQGYANYGVRVDPASSKFSGYAWSSYIGYISFNETELIGCPVGTCVAEIEEPPSNCAGGCSVLGWARACSVFQSNCKGTLKPDSERGGWEGWIKLNGSVQGGGWYGITFNGSNNQFHGYSFGGDPEGVDENSVIGWLSWNCAEGGDDQPGGSNICLPVGDTDYKVVYNPSNEKPRVSNLTINFAPSSTYCDTSPNILASIEWTYCDNDGDEQSEYHLQVATSDTFSPATSKINYYGSQSFPLTWNETEKSFCGQGSSSVIITTYSPSPGEPKRVGYRGPGNDYFWRIRVKDERDIWSHNDGTGLRGPDFDTPTNAVPNPEFTISNTQPEVGEEVIFTDGTGGGNYSDCWNTANNEYYCKDDTDNRYIWDFDYDPFREGDVNCNTDDNPSCFDRINGTITYTYAVSADYIARLYIKDKSYRDLSGRNHDGECLKQYEIKQQPPKPEWKEIPPFGRLWNGIKSIVANVSNFFNKIFLI